MHLPFFIFGVDGIILFFFCLLPLSFVPKLVIKFQTKCGWIRLDKFDFNKYDNKEKNLNRLEHFVLFARISWAFC